MRTATLALVVLAALAAATAASANRAPTCRRTRRDRRDAEAAVAVRPEPLPRHQPAHLDDNVLFAYVPNPVRTTKGCLRYKGNGFYILHRQTGKWVVFYQGSDPPVCKSRIPPAVTKDLTKLPCLKR